MSKRSPLAHENRSEEAQAVIKALERIAYAAERQADAVERFVSACEDSVERAPGISQETLEEGLC